MTLRLATPSIDYNGNGVEDNDIFEESPPKNCRDDDFYAVLSAKDQTDSPLPNIRWSEEEEDGAIYTVALKRLRYHSLKSDGLTPDMDLSCKQWETIKTKQIKAGTLQKLVDYLTPPSLETDDSDPGFFLTFLCTYKSFTTTFEVTNLLLKRYEFCQNNWLCGENETLRGIMKRVCLVFTVWFDKYPYDFDEPSLYPTLSHINKFTEGRLDLPGMKDLLRSSQDTLEKLTVTPFDYDAPYKFKFCSCPTIVGCTCEISICSATFEHQQSLNISKFSAELIAEQLTLADSELFLKVSPRECLGYFWSKRDPSKGSMSQSIKLTVDQFNAVSLKVISTVLSARNKQTNRFSVAARTKIIEKWIEVALELRELKNFSSLKAVLSGLQSSAIYRLTRTWNHVRKEALDIYEELSKIFSDDMNNKASRELLMQEGTAKYSTHKLKKTHWKRNAWKKEGITHGTVPYLGTFLTDLMMVDTAHPDKCKGDLINMDKRRKEFETIIQIKLFQQTAKDYQHITPSKDFFIWFNAIPEYGDKEGYNKSIEVEPPESQNMNLTATPQPKRKKRQLLKRCKSESDMRHEKPVEKLPPICACDSTQSLVIEGFRSGSVSSGSSLGENLRSSSLIETTLSDTFRSASINDISVCVPEEEINQEVQTLHSSAENLLSPLCLDERPFLIARIYFGDSALQYKSQKIFATSRACDVISMTLRKFNTADEPTEFSLYQILDSKKTYHIPMNSNIYESMRRCKKDVCFKVSKKKISSKKWINSGSESAKLSSFHRMIRKGGPLGTEEYGIMLQSYTPPS